MRPLILIAALLAGVPVAATAQGSCPAARTALVLSGGGAKGLAHVGVLQVLDSLGFIPDFIVGTSMGSVVGAMYAVGFTGNEIDSIVRHSPGGSLLQSFEPVAPRSLGTLQPMLSFAQGDGVSGLQTNALNERDVNALLDSKLFLGNLRARGDFDSLPIPFRAVATDLGTRKPVVLAQGDLPRAVRASIAIPIVFTPEYINGQYLADGGLSANIPIGIAREPPREEKRRTATTTISAARAASASIEYAIGTSGPCGSRKRPSVQPMGRPPVRPRGRFLARPRAASLGSPGRATTERV